MQIENIDEVKPDGLEQVPQPEPTSPANEPITLDPPKPKAKKAAAKRSSAKRTRKSKAKTVDASVTEVAEGIVSNGRNSSRWGSGRERDEALKKAGYDPEAVRKEVVRIRGEKLTQNS